MNDDRLLIISLGVIFFGGLLIGQFHHHLPLYVTFMFSAMTTLAVMLLVSVIDEILR